MIRKLPVNNLKSMLAAFGIDAPEISLTDMVLDSREVGIHTVFIAVKGHTLDGREFIPQAISLGAKAIIAETEDPEVHGAVDMREHSCIVHFYQLKENLSKLADDFFEHASQELDTVAVTGTNGKTSTTHFCCQLSTLMQKKSHFVGTLGVGELGKLTKSANTTPDGITMHRLAYKAVNSDTKMLAFEASSHALVQGRILSFATKTAIFTNLSRDHLDYHGSMEEYAAAKRLLLKQPGLETVVLNADDPEYLNWIRVKPAHLNTVLIGLSPQSVDPSYQYCFANEVQYHNAGVSFNLSSTWGEGKITVPLYGDFNIANLLCAIAAHLSQGADFNTLIQAATGVKPVDGRAEIFSSPNKATIAIDYAHTPDALEKILMAMRNHCDGKLICIFGCGGDRDQGKRPLMGSVAERYSDSIIVTNDNVRTESPTQIIEDIKTGISDHSKIKVLLDRKDAIKFALDNTEAKDLIVVAGKGHEDYQIIGDESLTYNERQFVAELYNEVVQ